jgi:hypothetical protein
MDASRRIVADIMNGALTLNDEPVYKIIWTGQSGQNLTNKSLLRVTARPVYCINAVNRG